MPMPTLPNIDLAHAVTQAATDLRALDGASIFLTGGTGFFGRWLVESWLWARRQLNIRGELHLLMRSTDRWTSFAQGLPDTDGLTPHVGSQSDFVFPDIHIDFLVHGAVDHGAPKEVFARNIEGTRRTLDFAKTGGAGRFLFLSSGAVYGPQQSERLRLPETEPSRVDPTDPLQAYGAMKQASEHLGLRGQTEGGPSFISARAFAFHGPGLPLDHGYAIGNFMRDALGTGPIYLQGDGTPRRSYLYAADLAVWLWALLNRGRPGAAYNVGSPEALSILSLAERVRDLVAPGREISIRVTPPEQTALWYVPDTTKAEKELGLHPIIGLDEGIQRTACWYRENPWV